jgi:Na+-transporting methylmalonyl-CoA/oxaloacetate decarboxylase gamma subunit
MKKIGFLMIALLLGTIVSMGQNWQSATPEEMAKRQTDQIKEKCGLDKNQEQKVYALSLESGKKMAKMREEMQASGGPSDEMREKMMKIRDDQNKEMKKILTADQYVKYEKYLEERRAARQQQQGGGGPK